MKVNLDSINVDVVDDVIKWFASYGITGMIILAISAIAIYNRSRNNTVIAIIIIGIIYFDQQYSVLFRKMQLSVATITSPESQKNNTLWIDTNLSADWIGKDRAFTTGKSPKYRVDKTELCSDDFVGAIAVCWIKHQTGYPDRSLPNDVTGTPEEWCTYKKDITLATPPDGIAIPSRVYLCAHTVPH